MKNPTYILFFIFLFGITACKKKSEVVIQAQNLTDLSDGSHYAGKNYVVVESWTPIYETKSKEVKSGVLDDNGHASFDLKMKNNRKYVLAIGQPNNVCYTELKFHSLNNEKSNNVTFNYVPCGYLKNLSHNVNCEGVEDKMQLKFYYTLNPDIYIYIRGLLLVQTMTGVNLVLLRDVLTIQIQQMMLHLSYHQAITLLNGV